MSRYKSFKYGTRKYGATTGEPSLYWGVDIDWDGDYVWDGYNEAERMTGLSVTRGRSNYLKTGSSGIQPFSPGSALLTLDNADGRYNPWLTSGPLFGKILPGRFARIRVRDGATGVIYPIFAGRISDIEPITGENEQVQISLVDGLQWLADNGDISIPLQQYIDLGAAIDLVLDAAGWPALWGRTLDSGLTSLPWFWATREAALEQITALSGAGLGEFFAAADGKATFCNRHHAGLTPLALAADQLGTEIGLPQPWEYIRNQAQVRVSPRSLEAAGTIWELGGAQAIYPGQTLTLDVEFSSGGERCPATGIVSPVATTDYTVNTLADGTGENITGQMTVSFSGAHSTGGVLAMTNNTSLQVGYITLLRIRGQAVTNPGELVASAEDAASQAAYGKRTLQLNSAWMQTQPQAQDCASALVGLLAQPHHSPRVRLENRPAQQFGLDLQSRVTLDVPTKGINLQPFKVGRIEHRWLSPTGQAVETLLTLEPYTDLTGGYWVFSTELGVTSILGY